MSTAAARQSCSKLTLLLSLVAVGACSGEPANQSEAELGERARGIHERVITLDMHNDINAANFTAERNCATDLGSQVDLPNMEAGGLDGSWIAVFVGRGPLTAEGYANAHAHAIEKFDAIHRLTRGDHARSHRARADVSQLWILAWYRLEPSAINGTERAFSPSFSRVLQRGTPPREGPGDALLRG